MTDDGIANAPPQEDVEHLSDALSPQRWWPRIQEMGWLASGTVTQMVLTILVGLWIARSLGPTDFGGYSVVLVLVSFAVALTTFRLEHHLSATLSGAGGTSDRSWVEGYRDAVSIAAGVGVTVVVLAGSAAALFIEGDFRVAAGIGLIEVLFAPFFLVRSILQVQLRQRDLALLSVLSRGVWAIAVGVVLLIRPQPLLLWVVGARLVSQPVEVVTGHLMVGTYPWRWRRRPGRGPQLRRVFRQNLPLVGAGLAGTAHNRIDQPLIAALLGRLATGLYASATRVAEVVRMLPAMVENIMLPRVAEAERHDNPTFVGQMLRDSMLLMLVPGGLCIAVLVGAGEHIITKLLGSDYSGTGDMLAVLAVAEVFVFISAVYQMALLSFNRRGILFRATAVSSVVNITLNLLLLRTFGAITAAWASLVAYALASFVAAWGVRDRGEVLRAPATAFARCFPAIAAATVTAYTTRSELLVCIPATTAVYVAVLAVALLGSLPRLIDRLRPRQSSA